MSVFMPNFVLHVRSHVYAYSSGAAFFKRRNITPPFHIKAADCSLYLAANVAHFLSKRG